MSENEQRESPEFDPRLVQQLAVLFLPDKHPMITWQIGDKNVASFYDWSIDDQLKEKYGAQGTYFRQIGAGERMSLQGTEIWEIPAPKTEKEKAIITAEISQLFPAIRQRVEAFVHSREG